MFFAVNPWLPGTVSSLLDGIFEAPQAAAHAPYVLLLIDGSFAPTFIDSPVLRRLPGLAVYANTSLEALKSAGLWLFELPRHRDQLEKVMSELKPHLDGKPMWSLLSSVMPAAALAAHLRPFLFARTGDGLDWPVRWGDTRVLPNLLGVLTKAERTHLMSPLHAWLYLDRQGALQVVNGPGGEAASDATPWQRWELDDQRFHALVDAGEADHILAGIDDVRPDLLKIYPPAQTHHRVQQCLQLADGGRIASAPPRQALSMLALMLHERFMCHPAFKQLLHNTREGSTYEHELQAMPDDFWTDCVRDVEAGMQPDKQQTHTRSTP